MELKLSELPECSCGKGKMLPVEDTARTGNATFLRGWFCPACKNCYMYKNGYMESSTIIPALEISRDKKTTE